MRPVPMAPTLMRLLGAEAPKTEAGTIDGKPAATSEPATPLPTPAMNLRRVTPFGLRAIALPLVPPDT